MAVIDYCNTVIARWWTRPGRRRRMGGDPGRHSSRVSRAAQRPALRDMSVRGAITGNYILLLIIKGVVCIDLKQELYIIRTDEAYIINMSIILD